MLRLIYKYTLGLSPRLPTFCNLSPSFCYKAFNLSPSFGYMAFNLSLSFAYKASNLLLSFVYKASNLSLSCGTVILAKSVSDGMSGVKLQLNFNSLFVI